LERTNPQSEIALGSVDGTDPRAPVATERGGRGDALEQVRVLAREPDVTCAVELSRLVVSPAAHWNYLGSTESWPAVGFTGLQQHAGSREVRGGDSWSSRTQVEEARGGEVRLAFSIWALSPDRLRLQLQGHNDEGCESRVRQSRRLRLG
jgi:hypothetical protein